MFVPEMGSKIKATGHRPCSYQLNCTNVLASFPSNKNDTALVIWLNDWYFQLRSRSKMSESDGPKRLCQGHSSGNLPITTEGVLCLDVGTCVLIFSHRQTATGQRGAGVKVEPKSYAF